MRELGVFLLTFCLWLLIALIIAALAVSGVMGAFMAGTGLARVNALAHPERWGLIASIVVAIIATIGVWVSFLTVQADVAETVKRARVGKPAASNKARLDGSTRPLE